MQRNRLELGRMNAAEEIEVSKMSRAEKVRLLQRLVRELSDEFDGIEKNDGVCGGSACIASTRIPVWILENARRLGTSESDLLRDYPTLTAQDLANAWLYVASHKEEIDIEIEANES